MNEQRRALATLSFASIALLAVMPAVLGSSDAASARQQDALLAKLGLADSVHFSETDFDAGADRRWQFPRLRAAQLGVGEPLVFTLPGGRSVAMPLLDRSLLSPNTMSFIFSAPDIGCSAEIVLHKGELAGKIRATFEGRPESWSIASGPNGDHFTPANGDPGRAQDCGGVIGPNAEHPEEGGISGLCPDTGALVDVLLAYTPAMAATFSSTTALETALAADIASANSALTNSRVAMRFRIAGYFALTGNGSGTLSTDLTSAIGTTDGVWDNVHAERDAKGADIVAVITNSGGGGISAGGVDNPASAFCVCGSVGGFLLAHELGHNMGCCHAVGDGGGCDAGGFFPFSNGWRFDASGATYRTVMAYTPGTQIPYYSNPDVRYLGQPTGVPGDDPALSANNARTIGLTSSTVALHRCSTTPAADCDGDGIPDSQAIANGTVPDCNFTGIPDSCDIAIGISLDLNLDGLPDECPIGDTEVYSSTLTPLDTFGSAVSLSSKSGDIVPYLGIGAPGNDTGASNAGAAYAFSVNFGVLQTLGTIRAADPKANAFFGRGLAMYKRGESAVNPVYPARDFAFVGAYRWTDVAATGTFPSKGAAYLFAREGGTWRQLWRFTPPSTGGFALLANGLFGYSVAMGRHPREGADQLIVGAPGYANGQGRVYLMRNYFAGIPPREVGGILSTRQAPTAVDGDLYGSAVALEPAVRITTTQGIVTDRMLCVVGAPGRNLGKGAAYVFDRSYITSTTGSLGQFPLAGLNLTPPASMPLVEGDNYGAAVAVRGNLIAIGAPGMSGGRGGVFFWERSTTVASAVASSYSYRGFFKAPDGAADDALGSSISISPSITGGGFTVVVGAPKADIAAAGGVRQNAGKVYILHKTVGATGADLVQIRAAQDGATGDEFGYSASSVGGYSIIGAPFSDISGLNSGKARLLTIP